MRLTLSWEATRSFALEALEQLRPHFEVGKKSVLSFGIIRRYVVHLKCICAWPKLGVHWAHEELEPILRSNQVIFKDFAGKT